VIEALPAQRLYVRALEEADAIAEHHGSNVDTELVEQATRGA
jgi:hypothetical protein